MDRYETELLDQIELGFWLEDAEFAQQITAGPRLSRRYRAGLVAVAAAGVFLVMLFSVNLLLSLFGYLLLVATGTSLLRRRPLTPANQSPLEVFHRLTAGLFRDTGPDTGPVVEAGLD